MIIFASALGYNKNTFKLYFSIILYHIELDDRMFRWIPLIVMYYTIRGFFIFLKKKKEVCAGVYVLGMSFSKLRLIENSIFYL
jgi:hypothetical protein